MIGGCYVQSLLSLMVQMSYRNNIVNHGKNLKEVNLKMISTQNTVTSNQFGIFLFFIEK